jgi:hypothetical protein
MDSIRSIFLGRMPGSRRAANESPPLALNKFLSVSDLPPVWCQDSAPFGNDFRETI